MTLNTYSHLIPNQEQDLSFLNFRTDSGARMSESASPPRSRPNALGSVDGERTGTT